MGSKHCNWCEKTLASVRCESCKSAVYCSEVCQRKDADIHKVTCQGRGLKDFEENIRKPVFRRGLLLPVHEISPRLVWVRFNFDTDIGWEEPVTSEHIPEAHGSGEEKVKIVSFSNGASTDSYKIEIIAAVSTFRDSTKENKCLTNLMRGSEQYSWRGPILVLKKCSFEKYADIEGSDLQAARKFFADRITRKRKRESDENLICNFASPALNKAPGIKAVMISCIGDMREFGHSKFTKVSIDDDEWKNPYKISGPTYLDYLGLKLRFYKFESGITYCPGIRDEKDEEGKWWDPFTNYGVSNLLVKADPCNTEWGTRVNPEMGTYLVTGPTVSDIHPHQVEALESFCREIVQLEMKRQQERENSPRFDKGTRKIAKQRESLMAKEMSRRQFQRFFVDYRKKKIEEGYGSWGSIKCPLEGGDDDEQ